MIMTHIDDDLNATAINASCPSCNGENLEGLPDGVECLDCGQSWSPDLDGDENAERPECPRPLQIPKTLTVEEGAYWIGRAREVMGEDLTFEFVDSFQK
jgi:hypothetical protein